MSWVPRSGCEPYLVMTLSIFSGVSHLYAPTQPNAVLAQGSTTIAAHS